MKFNRCIYLLVLSGLLPVFAHAQLTLEEAILIALENNLDLKIARNEKEAAGYLNAAANSNFLPQIDANAGSLKSVNNVEQKLSSGQEINRAGAASNSINGSIALTYTLFDGLKMFAIKKRAALQEEFSDLLLKAQVQDVVSQVTLAYYRLVQEQQELSALEELIEISEERVKIANARFTTGTSAKNELLQSKVDLNAQRSQYLRKKAAILSTQAELNRLLGRDETIKVEVSADIPLAYRPNPGLLKAQLENHPVLLAAQRTMLIREQLVREMRGDALPELTFNSSYNYLKNENQAGFLLSNQSQGYNYGFTLRVPLFRGFSASKGLKAARLDLLNASLSLADTRARLRVELLQALQAYELATELNKLEEENMALARENLDIALGKFRLSQSNILELREAQQSLEEAQQRLIRSRFDAKTAEVQLRQLNGELVR